MAIERLFALALMCGLAAPALASEPACDRKASEIEAQIEHAEAAGNRARVDGLQKALSAVRKNCTDKGLIAEKRHDIAEQQEDIDELRKEILEKESEGRYDKVKKLQRKLAREQAEMGVLRQELADLEKG